MINGNSLFRFPSLSLPCLLAVALSCPLAGQAEDKYLGVATCASSNCHGATSPRRGTVLQNEFSTWHKHGRHSKAWTVLLEPDAQKIGDHLGIANPESDSWCLSCHATYVPNKSLQGDKYTVEDGVSCETCHGAAERWIASHTRSGATHEQNVQNGMTDLAPLSSRTRLCLDCHYGNENQVVNHKLIGAGHPRLTFELDTFSITQPYHWKHDDDYIKRKGEYISAKAWLVGQIILASERMATLLSPKRSKDGTWPELTLFTCGSCHHSLTEDQWKKRRYGSRVGELHLNLSSLIIAKEALKAVDSKTASEIESLMANLHEDYKNGVVDDVTAIKKLLDTKATSAAMNLEYNDANLKKLYAQMVRFGTLPYFRYEEAEQILMGMSSILASSESLSRQYKAEVDKLYEALQNDEAFKAEDFTEGTSKLLRNL
ncbi:MAG: hypothetical protein KDD70_15825 [Bdellovibrionales bacterium]|nr:hypothetical protein [Bdellovibrionales bacterium]